MQKTGRFVATTARAARHARVARTARLAGVGRVVRGATLLALVASTAAGSAPVAAQSASVPRSTESGDDARLAAAVDSIFAELDRPGSPGAAVAVLHRGRLVLERGYGRAHLEYDVPVTPATVFHVASVSKQFATFAVALLEEQGLLSLDDDIRTHLPELHDVGHRITIRHLIHHTSGIRDQWELAMMAGFRLDDVITRDQIMALMRRQRELNFEPGSEHLYSNMGYTLLAEIVERVTGQPYGEFLHRHVFVPLGMNSTHVHADHERVVPNRAYSYRPGPDGSGWRNSVLSYANQGATSLFTTAGDLARWLHNYETKLAGGPAVVARMYERGVLNGGDTISYAFAISRSVHRGHVAWGHGGADAGFRSYAVHFPDDELGVVVLSNAATTNPGRYALAVADAVLGLPPEPPHEAGGQARPVAAQQAPSLATWQPTTSQLAGYAGDYYSPELGVIYTVAVDARGLVVSHHRMPDSRLTPMTEEVFRSPRATFRFERGADGSVTGFRVSGGRVRNLAFVRLTADALQGVRPH